MAMEGILTGLMLFVYSDEINFMKIAFFGSDAIALPCLDAIIQNSQGGEICGVLTQPDRKSGRGRKLQSNPVKQWALDHGIPVQDPQKPGDAEVDWLKNIGADLTLVMAYGHILKDSLLEATPLGCFNLHASLLPKYRGASPIETSLAMGESETGVTLMRVIPRMDAGPIIDMETVPISSSETGSSLREKLAHACVPLILRNLADLLAQKFSENVQDEKQVTYCRKLTKQDGQIDFSLSAEEIENRSRAFASWPGCYFFHEDHPLRVGELRVHPAITHLACGERCSEHVNSLILGTSAGAVEILALQKPGGKMLPIAEFLRGYSFPAEITFCSVAEKIPLCR